MFDPEKLSSPPSKPPDINDVALMSVAQLLELRGKIDARLPTKLSDLNLETEIIMQLHRTKELMNTTLSGSDNVTPANQKAQVVNSCSAQLEQLIKMQVKLYSAERIKGIEQMVIRALRTLPREAQEAFFAEYDAIYQKEKPT